MKTHLTLNDNEVKVWQARLQTVHYADLGCCRFRNYVYIVKMGIRDIYLVPTLFAHYDCS